MKKLICLAMGLLAGGCLLAAPEQETKQDSFSLHWEELAPLVVGNRVDSVLTDGTRVKGKVLAVRPDALVLDSKAHEVPRASISVLRVTKTSATWRAVGTSVGTGLGMLIAIPYGAITRDFGGSVAIAAGGAGLGYLAGHSADHQVRIIRVIQ